MRVSARAGSITDVAADAIVVNIFEGAEKPGGATAAVDAALDGAISRMIKTREITGKANEITVLHTLGRLKVPRVAVVGLGKAPELDLEEIRQASGTFARTLRQRGCRRVATVVHGAGAGGIEAQDAAEAIADGAVRGLHRLDTHKSEDELEGKELSALTVVELDRGKLPGIRRGLDRGRVMGEATNYARNLVNEPPNLLTPERMAEEARKVAEEAGLEVEVLDPRRMQVLKMGALLAVGSGSANPPRLMVLKYMGGKRGDPIGAFVGKGITFDTGGISIKPRQSMDEMKMDMAGAAAVLGAMRAIGQLRPRVNLLGLAACAENMPSDRAYRPGDILTAMNGKTIEIIDTDAEGRLVLADALAYAVKLGASSVIDLATLTGACIIALGSAAAGIMGAPQEFVQQIIAAGERSGEKIWQLPLYPEYDELLKSAIADVKNIGERDAGAIQGAIFLRNFVGDARWAHLDIAGKESVTKDRPYISKGASGWGVRTLAELAHRWA